VDNVVEAVQCALERGAGGRAYFVNDQQRQTFRAFIAMLAGVQGLSIDRVGSMPYRLAFTLGGVLEAVWTMTLRADDPPLSRSMVRMIGREFSTNDAAARRELGYVGKTTRADGLRIYEEASPTKT
jgi:nucleoside-diphosphate-sugar epimerase